VVPHDLATELRLDGGHPPAADERLAVGVGAGGGGDDGPVHWSGDDPQPPETGPGAAEDGAAEHRADDQDGAAAQEQAILDQLPGDVRAVLEDALGRAQGVAERASGALHEVADRLNDELGYGPDDPRRIDLIGEDNRVKKLPSLARKFLGAAEDTGVDVESFLASNKANDLVRFSVLVPGFDEYPHVVTATIDGMVSRGYEHVGYPPDGVIENYWKRGNSYFGLSTLFRSPDGHVMEVQFPTEVSWRVGKLTHAPYEIIRLATATPEDRVHAFLRYLRVVKESGINELVPERMPGLPEPYDTGFAGWLRDLPRVADGYRDWLADNGRDIDDVLAEHGLTRDDLPDFEPAGYGWEGGTRDDDVLPGAVPGDVPGDGLGADAGGSGGGGVGERPAAGGELGPPAEDVAVQPGGGGAEPVRPAEPEELGSGGPGDGGTDSPGGPEDGAAERGDAAPDVRDGPGRGVADDEPPNRDPTGRFEPPAEAPEPPEHWAGHPTPMHELPLATGAEAAEAVRAHLHPTAAGWDLSGDPRLRTFAEAHPAEPGVVKLSTPMLPEHAVSDGGTVVVGNRRVTPAEFADLLDGMRAELGLDGNHLKLRMCYAGRGDHPLAQLVSERDLLVSGGTERQWSYLDGREVNAGPDLDNGRRPRIPPDGAERTFHNGQEVGAGQPAPVGPGTAEPVHWSGPDRPAVAAQLDAAAALRTDSGELDPDALRRFTAQVPDVPGLEVPRPEDGGPVPIGEAARDALRRFTAGALDRPAGELSIRRITGEGGGKGQSGAPVFRVHDAAGELVAVTKVFPKTDEFARELSVFQRLGAEQLDHLAVPEVHGVGMARGEQEAGVLVTSVARGRALDDLMQAVRNAPAGEGPHAMADLERALAATGRGLAELHTRPEGSGGPPAADFADRHPTDWALGALEHLERFERFPAEFRCDLAATTRRFERLREAVRQDPGGGALLHGDAHPGNFFYDTATGSVTAIDLEGLHPTMDATGRPVGIAGVDVGNFEQVLGGYAERAGLADELPRLRQVFLDAYRQGGGHALPEHVLNHYRACRQVLRLRWTVRLIYGDRNPEPGDPDPVGARELAAEQLAGLRELLARPIPGSEGTT
jgi:aminoglycoside phosphotransferase (APT) family kinase protein